MDFNLLLLERRDFPSGTRECAALGIPPILRRSEAETLVRVEHLPPLAALRMARAARHCGGRAEISGPPEGRILVAEIPPAAWNRLQRRMQRGAPPLPRIAREIHSALRACHRSPRTLLLARRWIRLGRRTLIQGILNVTPDSFYDGGRYADSGRAVERALQMAEEGADLVDIGGESTRPGSRAVPAEEEMRRILPVIEALSGRLPVPISVDTTKSEVAAAALEAGAEVINDVSGLSFDPRVSEVAARHQSGLIISHIQGRPWTMQRSPRYRHLIPDVLASLRGGVRQALKAGVRSGSILIDPGIGFGKSAWHNVMLLRHLMALRATGYPVMVGASRKSFLSKLQERDPGPDGRLDASLGAAAAAVWYGASALRVHDVAATVRAARSVESVRDVRVDS